MTRRNKNDQAKALAYISSEYFFLNKKDKGLEILKKAEALDGDSPAILEQLGDVYLLMGDKVMAKKYWKSALEKGGNSARLGSKIAQ